MVVSLNQPIVTDFHPIRNRPVGVVVLLLLLAVAAIARDLVAAALVVAVVGTTFLAYGLFAIGCDPQDADADYGGPFD